MQPRACIAIEPGTEACLQECDGLGQCESQRFGRDAPQQASRDQIGRQIHAHARGEYDLEVRGQVVEEVQERLLCGGLRQPIRLVHEQNGMRAELSDLPQPFRQPVDLPVRQWGAMTDAAERPPAAAHGHGYGQTFAEASRIVRLIDRQPPDDGTGLEPFASPLAEERGLAEAGRRRHGDDRRLGELESRETQVRPLELPLRPARRGGLEDHARIGIELHARRCPYSRLDRDRRA